MKKLISISALTAVTLMSAPLSAEAPYRIYLGAFASQESKDSLSSYKEEVIKKFFSENKLGDDVSVIDTYENNSGMKILYLDTKDITLKDANILLGKIRNLNDFNDAFMKLKTEKVALESVHENHEKTESDTNSIESATQEPVVEPVKSEPIVEDAVPALNEAPIVAANITDDNASKDNLLTLQDAVKITLKENPELKEAEFNYLQTGKDLNIAKNNIYYPTLDLIGSHGNSIQRVNRDGEINKGSGRRGSIELVLTENLFNGGADVYRSKSQNARLDSAAYSVAQKADRLTLSLANAYIEVIKTKKILEIEEQNVQNHEQIYNQIKDRAQSGFGVASEERQAGSRFTLAQSNLIAAKNNYEDALSTFEKIYGSKVDSDRFIMPTFDIALPDSEKVVYDKAMLCNPALLVQKSNIKVANFVIKEKDAPFLPKVDLELSGKYEGNDVLVKEYVDASANALIKVRYNLFNKNADKLEKQKGELAAKQEQETLDALSRGLGESLRFSWQSYSLEKQKMQYVQEHVDYSKATLDAYQDEFRIGRRDLINLLDAQNEYNTALKEMITTETALLYAKYRLLDNMGMISDSFEPGFAKRYIQGACSIENDLR